MAPVSKMLIGGVALATLQGCGGPNKDTNLETKVDMTDALGTNNDVDENDVAEVKSNIAQTDAAENIGEKVVANVSGQGVESVRKTAARNVEDLQKKPQQIWNAVMSKKGGAIAAGVALTGTLATAIGYKVKQHRAQAGRTCTAVGEGVSDKFVGVRYYDGQKVNFECATGYTLTDDEVTVECDSNGEARITACSKNSLTILGYPLRKIFKLVAFLSLAGGLAYGAWLKFTETQKLQQEMNAVNSEINDEFVKDKDSVKDGDIKAYVNKCYDDDGSSTKAKALAKVIDVKLTGDSSDKNKETLCKGLAAFVNKKIADLKNLHQTFAGKTCEDICSIDLHVDESQEIPRQLLKKKMKVTDAMLKVISVEKGLPEDSTPLKDLLTFAGKTCEDIDSTLQGNTIDHEVWLMLQELKKEMKVTDAMLKVISVEKGLPEDSTLSQAETK